jgi:hypothetical protein
MRDRTRFSRWTIATAILAVSCLALGASTATARKHRPRPPAAKKHHRPRPTRSTLSAAQYPPIGAAVDTAAPHAGGGYEIEIGGNCLANESGCQTRHYPYGSSPVQILVLNRSTLRKVTDTALSTGANGAATAAGIANQAAGGADIVILASLPGTSVSSQYKAVISTITGASDAQIVSLGGGFAGIGVPTNPVKPGHVTGVVNDGYGTGQTGRVLGELRGYFQQNQVTGNWAFLTGRYSAYNTYAPGSGGNVDVMTIGGATYTLTLPSASSCVGGYAIVILNGSTLQPVSQTAVATNCSSRAQMESGLDQVVSELSQAAGTQFGTRLLFMQSIGNPENPSCACYSYLTAPSTFVAGLGGSGEVWNQAWSAGSPSATGKSGFALVGTIALQGDAAPGQLDQAYAPESATYLTSRPAQLQGLLRSDQNFNYVPVSGASIKNALGPSLATIVYGTSSPWLTGSTPHQQKVLAYISNGMKRSNGTLRFAALEYSPGSSCYDPVTPDVRFEFCDATRSYSSINSALEGHKTAPASCGCTASAWTAVRDDLMYEISLRKKVLGFMSLLNGVYNNGSSCANAIIDLKQITTQVRDAVTVSNNHQIAGGRWDSLASDSFNVLSAISYSFPDYGALSNVLNDISAFGYLAGDLLGFSESGNSLASLVNTTAAQLGPKLQQLYCNAENGLGRFTDVILSDYGKLTAAGTSPDFQIDLQTLNTLAPELQIGAERFIYNHLLPAVYHPYTLLESNLNPVRQTVGLNTPLTYTCVSGYDPVEYHLPWKGIPSGDWIELSPFDIDAPWDQHQGIAIVYSAKPGIGNHPDVPPKSIINTVEGPVSSGGLGETSIDLFLHNSRRYAIQCGNGGQTLYGPTDYIWP